MVFVFGCFCSVDYCGGKIYQQRRKGLDLIYDTNGFGVAKG
jgi:hypothetical protein